MPTYADEMFSNEAIYFVRSISLLGQSFLSGLRSVQSRARPNILIRFNMVLSGVRRSIAAMATNQLYQ